MSARLAACHYQSVMSILIVDDHPSCRAAFKAVLENDGFAVVGEAGDGASALSAARELHPEVVLLDVQLPDTDGFTVASELVKDGAGPQVVLTSSRDAADFGPLITESGARGFIPKAEVSADRLTALLQ
jgi:DNA-binding NarL/FixJ family response regulator